MKKYILKGILDDAGHPRLKETSESYHIDNRVCFDNPKKIYDLACQLGCDELAEEEVYCLCMNKKLRVVGLFMVSHGTVDGSPVSIREIFQKALLLGAVGISLWHNHPTGDVTPSVPDVTVTKQVKEAGQLIGIELLDHVIVGRDTYCSFREEGMI